MPLLCGRCPFRELQDYYEGFLNGNISLEEFLTVLGNIFS